MIKPVVSVVFTTYNVEPYVKQSLDSICKQTLKNIQIIVVDDGSTDNTVNIIQEISEKDRRIHFIPLEKNTIGGVSTPANIGIEAAVGDYIGFADGDDIYDLTTFEKLYEAAHKYNADISVCQYADFDSRKLDTQASSDVHIWDHLPVEDFIVPNLNEKSMLLSISPVPWRKLYKKEFLDLNKIRFPEVDYFFEDNPFHWNVILNCRGVAFVREVLCFHRMNRVGQTMANGNTKVLKIFNHYSTMHDYCNTFLNSEKIYAINGINKKNAHSDVQSALQVQLLKWLLAHCYWCSSVVGEEKQIEVMKVAKPLFERFSKDEIIKTHLNGQINFNDLGMTYSILTMNETNFQFSLKAHKFTPVFFIKMKNYFHGSYHIIKRTLAATKRSRQKEVYSPEYKLNEIKYILNVENAKNNVTDMLNSFKRKYLIEVESKKESSSIF